MLVAEQGTKPKHTTKNNKTAYMYKKEAFPIHVCVHEELIKQEIFYMT